MEKIKFFNPCKHCLTRPVCKDKCDELGTHYNTIGTTLFTLSMLILAGTLITFSVLLWSKNILIFPLKFAVIFFWGAVYSGFVKDFIQEEYEGLRKAKLWQQIGAVIICPFGISCNWFFEKFDLEESIEKFTCRYYIRKNGNS